MELYFSWILRQTSMLCHYVMYIVLIIKSYLILLRNKNTDNLFLHPYSQINFLRSSYFIGYVQLTDMSLSSLSALFRLQLNHKVEEKIWVKACINLKEYNKIRTKDKVKGRIIQQQIVQVDKVKITMNYIGVDCKRGKSNRQLKGKQDYVSVRFEKYIF